MFEISKTDLAARIGTIHTNHGTVSTPAYVPVIHPVRQTIPTEKIKNMGFELVITNAYITRNSYGDKAIKDGIHRTINFDGAVMTDSGGYQVLEYGDIQVTPEQMARFETGIMTDFAIPLDKPTGFGMSENDAKAYVDHTLRVSSETIRSSPDNGQIWVGPIQGGEHHRLVAESTRGLVESGFRMLALGSPVEFMESYEYRLLAQMIITAKKNMPHHIPLHLFGAGHPLTIPFAVALGCDTFDSASYMLYAKQDRYIDGDGTRYLKDLRVFPCVCEVCSRYTPQELLREHHKIRTDLLAVHNLHAIRLEVDRVRQAIHEGRLWEYVMKKARAHPRLFEVTDAMISCDYLDTSTPRFKERAIFLFGSEDQSRPEVASFHDMVRRFRSPKHKIMILAESGIKPGYLSPQYRRLSRTLNDIDTFQICQYNAHLGIIPIEISDVFPAAHHESSRIPRNPAEYTEFARTWDAFFANNAFNEIHYADHAFLRFFVDRLPARIARMPLKEK